MATSCRYAQRKRQPGSGGRPDRRAAARRHLLPAAHRRGAGSLGNLATRPGGASSPPAPRVYAVGHRNLSHQGWWMAAVLACGDGALLSHRSAAMNWGLIRPAKGDGDITVSGANALN